MTETLVDAAMRLVRDGVSLADFPHALIGEPPDDMVQRALDPDDRSIQVVAWQGQRFFGGLRAGDIVVRHGPTRAPRIAVVVDPFARDGDAMRRLGIVTEGPLPGRYVRVIEAGAAGLPGFARRIAGPHGLMLPDTAILRHAGSGEALDAPVGGHPMIRRGSSGPAVSEAQAKLNTVHAARHPLDRCPLTVDAIFGPNTAAAALSFQRFAFPGQPSEWDGVIGPKTWAMLDAYARNDVPPDTPPIVPPIVPVVATVLQPDRWLPILRGSGSAPTTQFNAVKALVDGDATYGSMVRDIRSAEGPRSFLYLLGWDMYDNFPLVAGDCDTTFNALVTAAIARGVQVRAMIWDNLFKPLAMPEHMRRLNTLSDFGGILDSRTGGAVPINAAEVEAVMTAAAAGIAVLAQVDPAVKREWDKIRDNVTRSIKGIKAAHHQKVMIIFNGDRLIAYCGGLDLNPNRMMPDITTCGTGSHGKLGKSDPQHDTHCRIVGPAAIELLRTFVDRWLEHPATSSIDTAKGKLRADPITAIPSPPVHNPSNTDAPFGGSCSVIVARTYTPVAVSTRPIPKQRDIRDLLLTAIANARRFIYLEDQYLIDLDTARALNAKLDQRDFSHITILIPGNDISGGLVFPQFYRQQFIDTVIGTKTAFAHRLRVFQLNNPPGSPPNSFGRRSYVHSKCWVIDDELAVIGSANCNRRGYQHDSEIDAFIFDDAMMSGGTTTLAAFAPRETAAELSGSGLTFAQQFRMKLWTEHLGAPASADGTDTSLWPTLATSSRGPLGVEPFDPVHPPHHPAIRAAISAIAPKLRNLVDPASP